MVYLALVACYAIVLLEIFMGKGALIILIPYGILVPLVFTIPRIIINRAKDYRFSPNWLKILDSLGLATILINAPGSLWLHKAGIQYDRVIHLLCGIIIPIAGLVLLMPIFKKWNFNKRQILSVIFSVTALGLFIWEGYQWLADQIFGTRLFFDAAQPIHVDVTEDIIYGLIGVIIAMFIINARFGYFSKLVSRRPESRP